MWGGGYVEGAGCLGGFRNQAVQGGRGACATEAGSFVCVGWLVGVFLVGWKVGWLGYRCGRSDRLAQLPNSHSSLILIFLAGSVMSKL